MKTVKIVLGVMLILTGITTMAKHSFLGGLLISISGMILLPPIEKKLKSNFTFFNKRPAFIGAILIPMLIGASLGQKAERLEIEKNTLNNKTVVSFIKNNTEDKSLNNIRQLIEIDLLFNNYNDALLKN